jgi:hypothetical protein
MRRHLAHGARDPEIVGIRELVDHVPGMVQRPGQVLDLRPLAEPGTLLRLPDRGLQRGRGL